MAPSDEDVTKADLLERARELEIEGRSSMTKEELVEAISEAEGQSPAPDVPDEVLEAAQEDAEQRRDLLRLAVDEGYNVAGSEVLDDGSFVLLLEKDGKERRGTLGDDGELRLTK